MANHYSRNEKNEIFSEIMKEYYKSVRFYCYKKLNRNSNEAEDCAQEVFYTLFKTMDELRDFNKIGKWLYRTADNCIKKILTKKSFENKMLIHSMIDNDVDNIPQYYSPYFSYEDDYELLLESPLNIDDCKEKILSVLSSEEMTLWYLFFIEKKSQKEISVILHISHTSVRSKVLRLKFKLNKQTKIILDSIKS